MFWDDTPFESRAQFMLDNVMALSEEFLQQYDPEKHPGYGAFRSLLIEIYSKPEVFLGENELERFHALSYATQVFFFAAAEVGTLIEDGESLHLSKADFKKVYKKPSNAPFDLLPHFGIEFEYSKKEKPASGYATCDAFILRFPGRPKIAEALKQMSPHFAEVDLKLEYAEALVMLCKADFSRFLSGRPALRGDIDLLRPDIIRSTGKDSALYQETVRQSVLLGLNISASIQRYANPTWNINFLQRKKLRLKTIWCEGRNYIHLPIPFAQAEPIIKNRHQMPPRIQAAIERFGCVQCGRCKNSKTVKFLRMDNITICTGHGESSTIFMGMESLEEVEAVFGIVAALL